MAQSAPAHLRGAMSVAYRATLWVLLAGCIGCFVFVTFARPTEWYRTSPGVKEASDAMLIPFPESVPIATTVVVRNGKNVTVNVGRNAVLMSGGTLFPLVLQWGSVMVAALCTVALLPFWREPSKRQAPQFGVFHLAQRLLAAVMLKARRIATYPLPPRRFWSWACGGLNAAEALFMATWFGLAVVYLYYSIDKGWANIGARLAPPPPRPGAAPAPTTAGTGVPASIAIPALFLSRRLNSSGKTTGEALRGLIMVIFFPISRSSFLKWLLGTDFSYLVKFHRWMSWGTLWICILHSVIYMFMWGAAGDLDKELAWKRENHQNITGVVSMMGGIAIMLTSVAWMRANYYKVFINTHILGFIVYTLFGLMHYKALINWIMPGLLLYGMDRAFRFWQLASNWTLLQRGDVAVDGSVITVRLRWRNESRVRPGQTVYLRIPRLSLFQAHPYSVAGVETVEVPSVDGDDKSQVACEMTLHLKVVGDWAKGLKALAQSGRSAWVQVEGPYDTCLEPPPSGPAVVMIAGGVGVTPILGLLRHYLMHPLHRPRTTYLLWTCRALSELRTFGSDLLSASTPLDATAKAPTLTLSVSDASDPCDAALAVGGPFIQTALHYTGCEAEADQAVAATTHNNPLAKGAQGGNNSGSFATSSEDLAAADGSSSDGTPSPTARTTANPAASRRRAASLQMTTSVTGAKPALPGTADDALAAASLPAATRASSLLSSHPIAQPMIYAICVLLAFFGGYAALITSSFIDGYYSRTTGKGVFYPTVGVMQFFLMAAGTVLPPFVFLASLAGLRAWAKARGITWWPLQAGAPPASTSDPTGSIGLDRSSPSAKTHACVVHGDRRVAVAAGLRLIPADAEGGFGGKGGLMAGAGGLVITRGRPDVEGLLRRVKAVHVGECAEIDVLVGGPPAMWDAVVEACVRVGGEEGPALRPKRVAHQH